jgi:hypothetical protein
MKTSYKFSQRQKNVGVGGSNYKIQDLIKDFFNVLLFNRIIACIIRHEYKDLNKIMYGIIMFKKNFNNIYIHICKCLKILTNSV